MYERWVQQLCWPAGDRGLACYSELVEEGKGPGIIPDSDHSDIEVVTLPEVRDEAAELGPWLSGVVVVPVCVPARLVVLPHHPEIDWRGRVRGTENLLGGISEVFPEYDPTVRISSTSLPRGARH